MAELRNRSRSRGSLAGIDIDQQGQLIELDVPDDFEHIAALIDEMGDSCKELFVRFYFKNENWIEIARALGYSNAANARNQKYKCLRQLRKKIRQSNM